MSAVLAKVSQSSLRDRIVQQLEQAILSGTLKPGEKIVERHLAAQMGASTTAVREALVRLEAEGFITKRPNAATFVTSYTRLQIEKAFALRRVLEGYAFTEAIRLMTPEQMAVLEELYLQMVDAARLGNRKQYLKRDLIWHEALWDMAENEYLSSSLRRLVAPLFAFTAIRIEAGGRLDLLEDAHRHRPMLEVVKARDVQAAQKALDDILEEWLAAIRALDTNHESNEV